MAEPTAPTYNSSGKVLYRWSHGSHYHKDEYCPAVPFWHGKPAGFVQGPYSNPDADIPDKKKCSRCWRRW